MDSEHHYILANTSTKHLKTQAKIDASITFAPHDTHSLTHKKLTLAMVSQRKNTNQTREIMVPIDAGKVQRDAELVYS